VDQVIVALTGLPLASSAAAVSVLDTPTARLGTDVGVIVTDATTGAAAATVTVAVAVLPAAVAVIVALPAVTPVTTPAAETEATAVFDDVQVTVAATALPAVSFAVATIVLVAPMARLGTAVGVTEREATTAAAAGTVTVAVAVLPAAEAVMVVVPAPTPVTTPPFTVATAALLVDQVTVAATALPLESFAVAATVLVAPMARLGMLVGVTEREATTGAGVATVTDAAADLPAEDAVMVAVPGATPFTTPPSTVAAAVFEDDQVIVAGMVVPDESFAVATSVLVEPTARFGTLVGVSEMDVRTGAFATTVTEAVAALPPAVAVTVAVPGAIAFTTPALSTVATAVFEDAHANFVATGLPFASWAVATIVLVPPTVIGDDAE
jgi:hypothetical protein